MLRVLLVILIIVGALGYYTNKNSVDMPKIPGFENRTQELIQVGKTENIVNKRRNEENKRIQQIIDGN